MQGFFLLWSGQLISALGTSLTSFAITIWAFQETGQATTLALVGLFSFGPSILVGPLAGALVDRWNRRLVTGISDVAAVISTVVLLILHTSGTLEVWHLFVLGAWSGIFGAFQWPATSAWISTLVPKEQYGRTSGMMSLIEAVPMIAAPFLAALILSVAGLGTVLVIDIVTCVLAVASLAFVLVPKRAAVNGRAPARRSFTNELAFGFRYIAAGLFGSTLFAAARGVPMMMAGAFVYLFCMPILNGSSQAIWQRKVAPEVQGKVFAARRMLAQVFHPVSLLVAGPLADKVMEPAFSSPDASWLAGAFGSIVGTGPGAGMAFILLVSGFLLAGAAFVGILNPNVRNVEKELADHDPNIRPLTSPPEAAFATQ